MDNSLLQVRVITPRGEIFKADAKSVSSKNSAGKFDILAEHANFVTLIDNEPIAVAMEQGKTEKLSYKAAILQAFGNKVNIYTDIQPVASEVLITSD